MSLAELPLQSEALVDDNKNITLPWQVFLEEAANGDAGTAWSPSFVGLTTTGVPTITGVYYQISKTLTYFRITITPATDTTSVLGTTYCSNFPLTFKNDSANTTTISYTAAVSGNTVSGNRIYAASWAATALPVTIVGLAEVN